MQDTYKQFKEAATADDGRLCIVVADEAHWGITPDSAHDQYVNDVALCKRDNVIVVLVSATPANLLTSSSKIPVEALSRGNMVQSPSFANNCRQQQQQQQQHRQEDDFAALKVLSSKCSDLEVISPGHLFCHKQGALCLCHSLHLDMLLEPNCSPTLHED